MQIKILILFTLVAILSSLMRFGHRENNLDIASDSDYYLDMAKVFVGEQSEFHYENISSVHHYNRPLLAFCAGFLGHHILGDNYRAAFSIINIIAAIFIAYLLFIIVNMFNPGIAISWYPSILFLTSFSQMNFGYNILTETIGLAFALGACFLVYQILVRLDNNIQKNNNYKFYKDWKAYCSLFIILIIQMLSFLTRETAWFIFIFTIYIVINRRLYQKRYLVFLMMLFLILIVAKVPHNIYSSTYETYSTPLDADLKALVDPRYILDSILKLGIIFNICWIIIFLEFLFWKNKYLSHFHEFIKGWSVAALGYIAAGYLANTISGIGYPTRMFYSLFPLFFISVAEYLERSFISKKRVYLMSFFILLHAGIGIIGVILDSGTDTVHTIYDFLGWLKPTLTWLTG